MSTEYPECSKRQELTSFSRTGEKGVIQRCMEKTAPTFNQDVTAEQCIGCPVRRVLTLRERSRNAKPVKFEELMKVQAVKTDSTPAAGWLPCEDRQLLTVIKCCGTSVDIKRCVSQESSQNGLEVMPETCKGCGVRRPPASTEKNQ